MRRSVTIDHVYLAAALLLVALRPLLTAIPPNDFWWHLAMGREILATGAVPLVDSFSYTQTGQPFYNQAWLAQLLMVALYRLGGVPLLLVVQSAVIALAYGLLLRLCLLRSERLRLSVVLLLLVALPLSFDNWTIRPQSYVFPIFALYVTILTEYRLGRSNYLWALVPLMALWVNMHGSFVLGLALIGLTGAGELFKRLRRGGAFAAAATTHRAPLLPLALWGAACGLTLLLNPRGPAVIGYVRNLLSTSSVTSLVVEWAPPTIRDINGAIFFLVLIGCIVALTYARRKPDLTDMLLAGALLWLALGAVRNIVWFGFVATPLLAVQLATLLPPPSPKRLAGSTPLNLALIGMLASLLIIASPWVKPALLPAPNGLLLTEDTPVGATAALEQLEPRPQRLFHPMGAGSYLIWQARDIPVFIDPRIELYPYAQWQDYIALSSGQDVPRLLDAYGFDALLLDPEEQKGLLAAVKGSGWRVRYSDARAVLLTR